MSKKSKRPVAKMMISPDGKVISSKNYNLVFDAKTGFTARWGKTRDDDPELSPFGPEILDIEVSEICHGINNKPCPFCYKGNTGDKGKNMSFDTFKAVFDKMPMTLTQIAFGIGDIDSNPDLWAMMDYCRNNGKHVVVPNITINGWNLDNGYARLLQAYCGAVAVSRYDPPDVCYDAVKQLTDLGMDQINIHMLVSEETYEDCIQVINDAKNDPRLENLNAISSLKIVDLISRKFPLRNTGTLLNLDLNSKSELDLIPVLQVHSSEPSMIVMIMMIWFRWLMPANLLFSLPILMLMEGISIAPLRRTCRDGMELMLLIVRTSSRMFGMEKKRKNSVKTF